MMLGGRYNIMKENMISRGGGGGSYPTGQAPHKTGGECISPAGIDSYLFHSFIRGRGEGGGTVRTLGLVTEGY